MTDEFAELRGLWHAALDAVIDHHLKVIAEQDNTIAALQREVLELQARLVAVEP